MAINLGKYKHVQVIVTELQGARRYWALYSDHVYTLYHNFVIKTCRIKKKY